MCNHKNVSWTAVSNVRTPKDCAAFIMINSVQASPSSRPGEVQDQSPCHALYQGAVDRSRPKGYVMHTMCSSARVNPSPILGRISNEALNALWKIVIDPSRPVAYVVPITNRHINDKNFDLFERIHNWASGMLRRMGIDMSNEMVDNNQNTVT